MPVNVGSTSSTGYLVTPTIPIRDNLQLFLDPADEKSYSGDTALIWKDLSRVDGSGNNFRTIRGSGVLAATYTNKINKIKIAYDSGNIEDYFVTLYGYLIRHF